MEKQAVHHNTYSLINRRNEALYYLSFIVWPFGVLLAALRNWDRPWSKNVFWLFCIYFGFTFIIAKEGGADSDRYAQLFIQYAHSDMNLTKLWSSFYSVAANFVDIASPLITFLVSRVTDSPKILFTVFALIFGYFHSRNIWYVLGQINGEITAIILLFTLTFALFNPIWNINGFRMWIAAQIFLFGTLPYLLERNSKKLFWSVSSVLFHFSFLLPVSILLLFIFLKNRINIYIGFFVLSSFIKEINLQSVQSALSFLPDIFQQRVTAYTNLDYAESLKVASQSLNWYIPFSYLGIRWITYIMTLFIYFFCRKFLKSRQELMTLFCFSLLLYGFANIYSLVPSGGRFLIVADTFMFAFFIIFISISPKIRGLGLITVLSIPMLLLFCIVTIRSGMDFYGLTTIIGNPIYATFYSDTVPLIEGIKKLFQ
jgi:hypothetical protein